MKTLEELGIGRPSTYASIIDTIQRREYVTLEEKRFRPDRRRRGRHRQADRALPRRRRRELHRVHGEGARRHRRGRPAQAPDARGVQRAVRARAGEGGALVRAVRARTSTRTARCARRRAASPAKLQVKLGPLRQVHRLPELPGVPLHPQHGRQRARRARDARRALSRLRQAAAEARAAGSVRSWGAAATRTAATSRRTPPRRTGVTCPQCKQGELIEKRSRFGTMFYSCGRYPDCDCAVGNPPEKDHPCPECGSLLLRRPKSLRCWGCGAELDLDFNVTKPGDVEAETRRARGQGRRQGRARRRQEEDHREEEADRQEEAGREEEAHRREEVHGQEEARARRRKPTTARGRGGHRPRPGRGSGGGLAARVDVRRRGRRAPRDQAGDPEGPADPSGVLPAPGGDGGLLARGLGRVRRGDVAGRQRVGRRPPAFAIGGVMIARMLPAILFGPIAGALVDRVDRKQMMIIGGPRARRAVRVDGLRAARCGRSTCCRSRSSASRCCGRPPATPRCRTWCPGGSSRTRTRSGS